MITQETIDMYQAAIYWGQKKDVEYRAMNDREWTLYDKEVPSGKLGVIFNPNWVYRLRPSPPPEPVKYAPGAYWDVTGKWWGIPAYHCISLEHFKRVCRSSDSGKCFWPAIFDSEGFLIVPPEMNQNKE